MGKHFWKEAYKDSWELSSKKELFIKNLLEEETGFNVVVVGLGAGTDGFVEGNASDNNHEKGDADLYVEEIDAYLEVTGPNIPMHRYATLWFRPDKLNNSFIKLKTGKGKLHVLIHVQEIKDTNEKMIRCIILDKEFFVRAKNNEFKKIKVKIRGIEENYIEIYLNDKSIISFTELIEKLKNY